MSKSDIAVSVRGLSKAYTIAHEQEKHVTLAETLLARLKNPLRSPKTETFWALKDINFDIKKGDVVGIIGRNGAGKSTLLKILSRITEPTNGRIDLYGRVGSLLEVGTGFHPELTGRENIFLNGAILGMSKAEIKKQFDAIVDFAGVEKFLDTPVKRYSSGMYVRLAFAVAAHLNSEILIVDEVLAVGDSEFQKKCLGKMRDVSSDGRTVLFVSHNMAAVQALCSQAIYLQQGCVTMNGPQQRVVRHYMEVVLPQFLDTSQLATRTDRSGSGKLRLTGFYIRDGGGAATSSVLTGDRVMFVFEFYVTDRHGLKEVDFGVSIHTRAGDTLFVLYSSYCGQLFSLKHGVGSVSCTIDHFPVAPGTFTVGARVATSGEELDWPRDGIATLQVEAGDFFGTGHIGCEGSTHILVNGSFTEISDQSLLQEAV